jgi:hypothetical protein
MNTEILMGHSLLLAQSFLKATGRKLINCLETELSQKLYTAPFALLSHGTEIDPIFNYANLKAQELWQMPWDEFITTPSRLSAEPMLQEQREKVMNEVKDKGFIENYTGIRINKTGQRFDIKNTTIWNIYDEVNNYVGQAAMFTDWQYK